jgi:hypothetical protein
VDKDYPFLVAAHPSSGTHFVQRVLVEHGMDVGHEKFRPDGIVSSIHVGCGGAAFGVICAGPATKYGKVIHVVREPLKTISSSCTMNNEAQEFLKGNVELPPSMPDSIPLYAGQRIQFWTWSWIMWNRRIEKLFEPVARFRVEQLSTVEGWEEFATLVGVPEIGSPPAPGKDYSRKHMYNEPLNWSVIKHTDPKAHELALMLAREYGYEYEDEGAQVSEGTDR